MEIRNNNPIRSGGTEPFEFDPTRANREAIEKHRPEPVTDLPAKDEVRVSRAAEEALARETRTDAQRQQLDELKAQHAAGELNTPERIEAAANRMLLDG